MNNILTKLFMVIMLMMFSMGASADVKVLYGEKGTEKFEGTGGTIEVKQESDEKDGTKVTVFLTFIPQSGYTFDESSLKVYAVISPDVASTRAPEILGDPLKLTEEKTDVPSAKRYSVKIDSKLGLWVKAADFQLNGSKGNRGTLPVISTDENGNNTIDDSEKILYLIQSYSNEAFYMRNNNNSGAIKINTSNIVTTNSEFYFLDADEIDGTQYYYIVHKETGDKYVYMDGATAKYGNAPTTDAEKNQRRFKIIKNSTRDAYNIIPINQSKFLNKINGNSDGADVQLSDADNDNSCWYFIAKDNYTKPAVPFTPYTSNGIKAYYYIQNNRYTEYYLISGANPASDKVKTDTKTDANKQNMMWYFKKAPSSDNDPYLDYYYIIHAETGKYLRYLLSNNSTVGDNAVDLSDYNSSEEDKFLFIVVRGAMSGESHASSSTPTFCIAPKLPRTTRPENTISLCRRLKGDGGNEAYSNAGIFKERGDNNFTHWNFELAKQICANPVFAEEADGEITVSCATTVAEIRYTTDGTTPDGNSTLYDPENDSWLSSTQHFIKAIAVVKEGESVTASSVDVVTLLNKPDITLSQDSYTYNGGNNTPDVTKVSIMASGTETVVDPGEYSSTPTYTNNKDAGTANVAIDDVLENNLFILNASTTFVITAVPLTVTANAKTITYGDAPSGNGVTYGDFVGTDSENDLGGTLAYTYNYEQFEDVGDYSITPSGLTSDNYELSFVAGILTVEQKEVGLEWTNTSLPYNAQGQTPTATATGLVNNDVISVTVEGTQTEVGTGYTATATALTGPKASNYKMPADNTTLFDITKALLTITANDKTITYGQAPDHEGVVYSGFLGDEDENTPGMFTGSLDYTYNYNQYDDVGDAYTITPSGLTSDEYDISFVAGTLTVEQKEVGITWGETTTFTYNGSEQAPSATVNAGDLVNGDAVEVTVTGAQTDASTEPYTATASGLTGNKAGNYVPATGLTCDFTIEPKPLSSDGIEAEISKTVSGSDVSYPVTVKDGSVALSLTSDYTLDDPITSGSYTTREVTGANNYTGTVTVKYANVTFMSNDNADPTEWSATFVADADYDKPSEGENITPYIVTAVGSDVVEIQALENVPQGAPLLLLHNAASQPYGFMVRAKDNVSAPTGNLLRVAAEDMTVGTAEMYLLYKCEFVLNMAGTLPEGKVYLPKTTNAGARLMITNDQSTGIVNLQTDEKEVIDKWYSLDGRRLNGKPTKKGLYIKNGQKAVVK